MLDDFIGNYGGRLFVAVGGVGLALVVLIGILWLMRNRAPSPFVRGGKNRQPRLQVLDAAAVDARRRLVLVRRDGVEHLIMIGGPTDIVIESGIGDPSKVAASPRPVALESLPTSEPHPTQRLEPPREPQRVIARKPDPEPQLPSPPTRAAIEPPVAPQPERRPPPPPIASAPPTVVTPPPVVVAPKPAAVIERQEKPAPVVERPAPVASVISQTPAPVITVERKAVAEAVDILEAARERVLTPPQPEQSAKAPEQPPKAAEQERLPVAAPQTPILIQDAYHEASIESAIAEPADVPSITPPKPPGSDFESILDEEISNNLRAERVVPPPQPVAPPRPAPIEKREPQVTIVGDAALQSEVARIFGEISVKRDN